MAANDPISMKVAIGSRANNNVLTPNADGSMPVSGPGGFDIAAAVMTRPADTTAYTAGDLVANSVTSGSVVPLSFPGLASIAGNAVAVTGAKISKSTTTLTNASFRLHLFNVLPVNSVGDNAPFDTSGALGVSTAAGYVGYINVTMDISGTAASSGRGTPSSPASDKIISAPATGGLWGLLEVTAAYAPGNAETFTVSLVGLH